MDKINKAGYLFDKEQLEKILLYRSFIRTLISEIKNQLQRELNLGFIERVRTKGIKNIFTSTDSIFKALDNLMESANDDNFQSILGIKFQQVSSSSSESKQNDIAYNASVEAGPISTSAKMGFSNTKQHGTSTSINIKFADILIKHFNIKEYYKFTEGNLEQMWRKKFVYFCRRFFGITSRRNGDRRRYSLGPFE